MKVLQLALLCIIASIILWTLSIIVYFIFSGIRLRRNQNKSRDVNVRKKNSMKKYIISNGRGGYFVEGAGFTGTRANATRVNESDLSGVQSCLARATGIRGNVEAAPNSSFAVNYVRPQNRATAYAYGRTRNVVGADNNNPSAKRFATLGEAQNHGQRNVLAQGHVGYWVTETNDPVTHYVSVKEDPNGLTCPIANQ